MRVGIAFGCYCPLHQGHLDVIMRAKKENDLTFVFVCGYDNDRGGDALPLIKRYRIIANYLKDDCVVVGKIDDTQLGLDESMSDSNWKIWVDEARSQMEQYLVGESEVQYTWYVSEPEYKTAIEKLGIGECVLMDRTKNPVSGTLCRTKPLKYWHKITAPFRAYYSHNILITGTASEGKTTLTHDIGRYFSIPYSYEKGRDNCHLKTDPEFTIKDFMYNVYEQHKYNEELISSPSNPGVFISDTDNIVTLMYAYAYKDRPGFCINDEEYQTLYRMAKAYMQTTKWDKIFLIKPSKRGIVDDGERYMPDSDYEIRIAFYEKLKSLYDEFGYEYEELCGTYYSNFCTVRDYINKLYEEDNE